jgi:hypothetical protein
VGRLALKSLISSSYYVSNRYLTVFFEHKLSIDYNCADSLIIMSFQLILFLRTSRHLVDKLHRIGWSASIPNNCSCFSPIFLLDFESYLKILFLEFALGVSPRSQKNATSRCRNERRW